MANISIYTQCMDFRIKNFISHAENIFCYILLGTQPISRTLKKIQMKKALQKLQKYLSFCRLILKVIKAKTYGENCKLKSLFISCYIHTNLIFNVKTFLFNAKLEYSLFSISSYDSSHGTITINSSRKNNRHRIECQIFLFYFLRTILLEWCKGKYRGLGPLKMRRKI